jgi:3-keto-disaccharide hydrolase
MRCTATILSLLVMAGAVSAADDVDDFLKPDNWEGLTEYWKIEKDSVVAKADKDPGFNTFFCSKKKYKDFEMSFKVRLVGGKGNSGVQIRSNVVDVKKFVVAGPQADVGAQYWGSLYGEKFGGMMKQSDFKTLNVKGDDFNDYSIKCVGKKVTIKVNGVVAVDQEFDKMPDAGIIAFQLHAGGPMEVNFKNIQFKELK